MSKEAMKLALEAAYLAGFNASGEGYNGEYPFGDHAKNPEKDAVWIKNRDNAIREALAEQPAQQEPVAIIASLMPAERQTLLEEGHSLHVSLYTTPQQRKPLTHEQRVDLLAKFELHNHEWHAPAILIDMVEAAHGIKGDA